jgi:ABC-type glycerol-3-phosphate transport system permease component
VTFYVEFGFTSDRILQDLVKLGIGRRNDTKILVLPTVIILEGQINDKNESASTLSLIDDVNRLTTTELLPMNVENNNDLTLSRKIRKRINESNFKKSVRARLMVHQVVGSIRASTALSFDFVLLICLASMLAAFGLLENSTVIIVASMLVSPLMNPILGIVFGLSVREHSLWRRGLRNELIGLIICMTCGFILGYKI